MDGTLIVMRGLPWTGKSYTAKRLLEDFQVENPNRGLILSTDEYFYTINHPEKPDEYSFDPRQLSVAHRWNFQRAKVAIQSQEPLVIIDNTNTTAKEFCCTYLRFAYFYDYHLILQEPTSERWQEIRPLLANASKHKKELKEWAEKLAEGSKETHNVPAFAIEKMMWRWQPDLDVNIVVEECITSHAD